MKKVNVELNTKESLLEKMRQIQSELGKMEIIRMNGGYDENGKFVSVNKSDQKRAEFRKLQQIYKSKFYKLL